MQELTCGGAKERHEALQENVTATTQQAVELTPDGVILIKRNVFELLNQPLRDAGLSVLHDEFIPFPGSGQPRRFREGFQAALIGALEPGRLQRVAAMPTAAAVKRRHPPTEN